MFLTCVLFHSRQSEASRKKALDNFVWTYAVKGFSNSKLAKKLRTEGTITTINIKSLNGEEPQETRTSSGEKIPICDEDVEYQIESKTGNNQREQQVNELEEMAPELVFLRTL